MRYYLRPYACPQCRARRSCPHRPSKMTASAADGYLVLFVLVCLILGGIGSLIRYSVHHPGGWGILAAIILVILGMAAIRNKPFR